MVTIAVNLKTHPFTVYVGRRNNRMGLQQHPLCNHFTVKKYGRDEALSRYKTWIADCLRLYPKATNEYLDALRGEILGCYCKPLSCHADVLAMLADISHEERQAWADTIPVSKDTEEPGQA